MRTALFTLALGLAQAASGAVIFIDNFNTDQFLQTGPSGSNPISGSNGVSTGGNSFGGARSFNQTRTSSSGLIYSQAAEGILTFSLGASSGGYLNVYWDGDTDGTLNPSGVAPTDLTDGGSNEYIQLALRSDLIAPLTLTFYSGGTSSSYTLNTPGSGFLVPFSNYLIPMANFTGSVNWTQVTAVQMYVNGLAQPGVDLEVDFLAASPTPEPATFGIVLVGLGGLLAARRRRKA